MTADNNGRGIWSWQIVWTALAFCLLLFAVFLWYYGFTETGLRACIAWSAKISFTFFCLAFSAAAAHRLLRNSFSFWWRMNRKFFGITFAIVHLLHLSFLLVLQQVFHPVFTLAASTSLMAGGIAYFFTVAMLLTSFERFSRYLNKRQWKVLHTVGGYWIWMIFMSTYSKSVLRGNYELLPMVVALIVVLVFRLLHLRNGNRVAT